MIERYDVIDVAPRPDLLGIVELAAKVCGTPMATINLLTDTEQHQIATYGFDAAICHRDDSMCGGLMGEPSPVIIPDASVDDRFRDNPFVNGDLGRVRFYASHKLTTPDGLDIGTLCVFDVRSRDLDDTEAAALGVLAARVVDVLELTLRSRQLATSDDRLAAYTGRVSYELRTQLTTVSMALELLREQLATTAPGGEAPWLVERALKGSGEMAELLEEVFSYARLAAGPGSDRVDLDEALTAALARTPGLRDAAVVRSPLPTVTGDAVQLRSVLHQLLDNVWAYRDPSRRLRVAVAAERRERSWRISVVDNGRGIPPEAREDVFCVEVNLVDDVYGSGVGLDTCRRVVEAHGGTIGIDETPGGGTTVWFDLPY